MSLLPFIHHSNTRDIIARLDTAWAAEPEERRIVAVLGLSGTGKKALLDHWAREHRREVAGPTHHHAPIVTAHVREAVKVKTKKGAYATTAAFNAFSEIVFALGETAEDMGKKVSYNRWYQPTGAQYTDHQFNALYNFIRAEFKSLHAHALLLPGAEYLDGKAFEMLRRWYESRKRHFMLVLCFQMQKQAKPAETLRHLYGAIPDGWIDDPLELPRLERKEFAEHIVRDILAHLQIPEPDTVEAQLDLVKRYWRRTSGDWHAMVLRARDLKI